MTRRCGVCLRQSTGGNPVDPEIRLHYSRCLLLAELAPDKRSDPAAVEGAASAIWSRISRGEQRRVAEYLRLVLRYGEVGEWNVFRAYALEEMSGSNAAPTVSELVRLRDANPILKSASRRVFEEDYRPLVSNESNSWQPGRRHSYFRWRP